MGDQRPPPLQRLAALLNIPGEPITDYSWSDVVEAVENLLAAENAIRKVLDEVKSRPCHVYDHVQGTPCASRTHVQGVCRDHAIMCAMCGKELSARGICPACVRVLASERAESAARGGQPVVERAPVALSTKPEPTPDRPRRSRSADSF